MEAGGKGMLRYFLNNVLKVMLYKLSMGLAKAMGGAGGFWGGLAKSMLGITGSEATPAKVKSIPGKATGADFMVGGRPGIDNNVVAFRASNNERVRVETPGQQRHGGGMGNVVVYNNFAGANIRAASEEDLARVAEAAAGGAIGRIYADRRTGRLR